MPTEMRRTLFVLSVSCLLLVAGCIGTDFLEERLEFDDPYLVVTPNTEAVLVGEMATYSAIYFDSTGAQTTVPISWSVSDPAVASIGEDGVAVGIGAGQTQILASAAGITSDPALLTVVDDPLAAATVRVTPQDTSVTVGGSVQYAAQVLNVLGEPLAGLEITWRVTDSGIAEVTASGNVTTLEVGETTVIASAGGVESAPARISVLAPSRTGSFQARAGTSYQVSGLAVIESRPDGGLQLRFGENFSTSNGPDLYVYLSTSNGVTASSFQVGRLQSTTGAQIYPLPNTAEISDFDYVIIHCLPFNVSFGFARLIG